MVPCDSSRSLAKWVLPLPGSFGQSAQKRSSASQMEHCKGIQYVPNGLVFRLFPLLAIFQLIVNVTASNLLSPLVVFSRTILGFELFTLLGPSAIALGCLSPAIVLSCFHDEIRLFSISILSRTDQCRLWEFKCLSSNLLPISLQAQILDPTYETMSVVVVRGRA